MKNKTFMKDKTSKGLETKTESSVKDKTNKSMKPKKGAFYEE